MREVCRFKENEQYWDDRWAASGVDNSQFTNMDIYPIKYANLVSVNAKKILEMGCGAGRLYFHYKKQGKDIYGIEYSQVAVDNILKKDPQAKVVRGNVSDMSYPDESFDAAMAFGLYHNIQNRKELDKAFEETARVIKPGGKLVASFRFDSFENNLIEKIIRYRNRDKEFSCFHRLHFDIKEIEAFLAKNNMQIIEKRFVRNVSFLFKFDLFRSKRMKAKSFNETDARSSGFELNKFGKALDNFLHSFFPRLFSNLVIVVARKKHQVTVVDYNG